MGAVRERKVFGHGQSENLVFSDGHVPKLTVFGRAPPERCLSLRSLNWETELVAQLQVLGIHWWG